MIVVDASAMVAILLNEEDGPDFMKQISIADGALISAVNWWEVLAKAQRSLGDAGRFHAEALLTALNVTVVAVTPEDSRAAADAFARFGRHTPAALNMGDCFAYALAKAQGDGLLFKGNDFPLTDVGLPKTEGS